MNQYRNPNLYKNIVDWFVNTLEFNIKSNLEEKSKTRAISWRLLKLECAIAYLEAGNFPISDGEMGTVIEELKDSLSKEK